MPLDGPAMGDVHVESWNWAYSGILPDEVLDGRDPKELGRRWVGRTENDPTPHRVADLEGQVVGIMSVGAYREPDKDSPSGELWMINLRPRVFGTGIADLLHDEGIRMLRDLGHHQAALWVIDQNMRAIRLYRRQGWHPDRATKIEEFDEVDIRELRFVKDL